MRSTLTKHQVTCTGERPYKCDCGRVFKLRATLSKHQLTRTQERPYKCNECGKFFTWKVTEEFILEGNLLKVMSVAEPSVKSYLACHWRIHTGEKPCKCPDCRKAFTQASHLTRHQIIHIGENLTNATECNKGFSIALRSGFTKYLTLTNAVNMGKF